MNPVPLGFLEREAQGGVNGDQEEGARAEQNDAPPPGYGAQAGPREAALGLLNGLLDVEEGVDLA